MKISIISHFVCVFALFASLNAFAGKGPEDKKKTEDVTAAKVDASIYQLKNTNKIRLLVENSSPEPFRLFLKDSMGTVYYSQQLRKPTMEPKHVFSFVFNLDEMADGVYYFEVYQNQNKLVRPITIESRNLKKITF